ncbi:MAG: nucleotidyltransferase domain-containing protein, partial [Planctomycetota bacterium]|nr:nucleotidyltransferase domain-containing protein [Planctomycetota bacterium]
MSDWVEASTIFLTLAGSRLYGTSTPTSDVDRRGVCVPPPEVALGFARPFEQHQVPGEDTVIFSLRKFMELAAACNPNFIELLFAPDDAALVRRPTWERLVRRRDEFLSAAAFQTFTGYAASQLARLRSHRA